MCKATCGFVWVQASTDTLAMVLAGLGIMKSGEDEMLVYIGGC
jgi:hypothetical protein